MKKKLTIYTFAIYPNGRLASISVICEDLESAEELVREMVLPEYIGDGLYLNDEEPYKDGSGDYDDEEDY